MNLQQPEGDNSNIQSPLVTSSSDPHNLLNTSNTSSNPIGYRILCRRPIRRLSAAGNHQEHWNDFHNPYVNLYNNVNPNNHIHDHNQYYRVDNHYRNNAEDHEHHHFICDQCRNRREGRNDPNEHINNPYHNLAQDYENVQEALQNIPEAMPLGNIVRHSDELDNPRYIHGPFGNDLNLEPMNNIRNFNEPLVDFPEPFLNRMNLQDPLENPYEPHVNPFNLHEPLVDFQDPFNLHVPNNEPVIMNNEPEPILNQPAHRPCKCKNEGVSTRYATVSVIVIFAISILSLYLVYQTFPNVTEEESRHIKVPWNIEDAKQLGIVLNRYKVDNYYQVMAGVFLTYIFLQTFAIPGSLFLSILSGFLFPFYIALVLVCTCSMVGAALCFMLSQLLGRRLILKHFPEKASKWAVQVEKHKDNLFNYMVFLRITPILPNWFINLTAPVIGVPLVPFAFGTFIGVAPPSFFAIQGGQTLLAMTAEDNAFNMQTLGWLGIFALVSIIPIFLKNKV